MQIEVANSLPAFRTNRFVQVPGILCGPGHHIFVEYFGCRRELEGISQRMLTLTLKGLEQDGLVTRTMYPTIPPRVDYVLTPLGRKLVLPLQALYDWAVQHRPDMLAARERFQAKQRKATQQPL